VWPFRRRKQPGLGSRGEELAERFLKRHGLKILARNYRCPVGEADLVALDSSTESTSGLETIAFVEVKTRSSSRHTDPASAVNSEKMKRLRRVAQYYLANRQVDDFNIRFDVVAVVLSEGQDPQVEHIPDAF